MISFIVRLRFSPEDRAEVAETLRLLAAASRQEPGCLAYFPHHVEGNADTILIYEQYTDSAALAAHHDSDHFKKYAVSGIYQKMLERNREDLEVLL